MWNPKEYNLLAVSDCDEVSPDGQLSENTCLSGTNEHCTGRLDDAHESLRHYVH